MLASTPSRPEPLASVTPNATTLIPQAFVMWWMRGAPSRSCWLRAAACPGLRWTGSARQQPCSAQGGRGEWVRGTATGAHVSHCPCPGIQCTVQAPAGTQPGVPCRSTQSAGTLWPAACIVAHPGTLCTGAATTCGIVGTLHPHSCARAALAGQRLHSRVRCSTVCPTRRCTSVQKVTAGQLRCCGPWPLPEAYMGCSC